MDTHARRRSHVTSRLRILAQLASYRCPALLISLLVLMGVVLVLSTSSSRVEPLSAYTLEATRDTDAYSSMVSWLEQGGVAMDKLYFAYYAQEYRGVHSREEIPAGDLVLEIPLEYIMTSTLAKASAIGQAMTHNSCRVRTSHTWLAMFLLQERSQPESFWKPYLELLPQEYKNVPLSFTDEELSQLNGSFTVEFMRARHAQLRHEYLDMASCLPDLQFSYEDFVWARLVVITRIFGFTVHGQQSDGLVPVADMLNHQTVEHADVAWRFSDPHEGFIMTATKAIVKDKPVFDSYGRKCNHRFFVNYGFVLEDNPDNERPLPVMLRSSDPDYAVKKAVLAARHLHTEQSFQVPRDLSHPESVKLLSFLRIASASRASLSRLPLDTVVEPISLEEEKLAMTALLHSADQVLDGFDTTLDQDNALLADSSLAVNLRNAILMRRGEKQVAHFYRELALEAIRVLSLPGTLSQEEVDPRYMSYFEGLRPLQSVQAPM